MTRTLLAAVLAATIACVAAVPAEPFEEFGLPTIPSRTVSFGDDQQQLVMQRSQLVFQSDAFSVNVDGVEMRIIAGNTIEVSAHEAAWMRLDFAGTVLPKGASIKVTSALDGHSQVLDDVSIMEWSYTSAYFNGPKVTVTSVSPDAFASSEAVINVAGVEVGQFTGAPAKTICNKDDMRTLSQDPRSARIMPTGCTGWIIDDEHHCMLTAGHCNSRNPPIMEFNVPMSLSDGTVQHPSPEHQYPTDAESFQSDGAVAGNDWLYLGTLLNSNTRKTAFEAQKKSYRLAKSPATMFPAINSTMEIIGFGVAYTPTGQYSAKSQVQQQHQGALKAIEGQNTEQKVLKYTVDTTGGNSGSAIEDVNTGLAIGIHTNGGCYYSRIRSETTGANFGTSLVNKKLQAALANPKGVCKSGPRSA